MLCLVVWVGSKPGVYKQEAQTTENNIRRTIRILLETVANHEFIEDICALTPGIDRDYRPRFGGTHRVEEYPEYPG